MSEKYVYEGPEFAPPDTEGKVDTFSFDGVTAHVVRSKSPETYLSLVPPEASPELHVPEEATNAEVLSFISSHLAPLRDARADMLRRNRKTSSTQCRYRTGDVAYLLGRPFMLRVVSLVEGGQVRHAARGRANTLARCNYELSVVELNVMDASNFDQRKGTFLSWANPIVARNAVSLSAVGLERAGTEDDAFKTFMVQSFRGRPVRIDRAHKRVAISDEMVAFPPNVILYVCMRELAADLHPDDENARNAFVEKACPDWEQAREILADPDSIYRRQ